MKNRKIILSLLVLGCFAVCPTARAVLPAPDGGYPGANTAEGQNALFSIGTGGYNTAVGYFSLKSNTSSSFNTAVGAGTLLANTADVNTATGAGALLSNTTGPFNTANGALALFYNTTGYSNTAVGSSAMISNTVGYDNTASGINALYSNTTGFHNTTMGSGALFSNTTGVKNTAVGYQTLFDNMTGVENTAIGYQAGRFITGAGNVCIGDNATGVAGVDSTTWIRNVYDSVAVGRAVYVNFDDKIGTLSSSRRYKDEIRPIAKASEAILSLRPVSFRYKKEVDPTRCLSFGLIAEEVAHVNPDLVIPDRDGKPETVRYEAVNVMLLNEFLKEHRKVQEQGREMHEQKNTINQLRRTAAQQEATIRNLSSETAQQRRETKAVVAQLKEQRAQIQRVSAQLAAASPSAGGLGLSKGVAQVVANAP
jgi:hypothetical protein